jgi:hypothetical protein
MGHRKERDQIIAAQERLRAELASDLNEIITKVVSFGDITARRPFHWMAEFPEVFAEGGFDVVIANPPYYNIQSIKENAEKEWLEAAFPDIFSGESDIHYFFYERGVRILKEGGFLGFISSRYFIEAAQARLFREFLQDNCKVVLLVDFGSVVKIFKDATINTAITILQKCGPAEERSANSIKVVKVFNWKADVDSLMEHILKHLGEDEYHDPAISVFRITQSRLAAESWIIAPTSAEEIVQKVRAKGQVLSSLCDVFKSIESGLDTITSEHLRVLAERGLAIKPPVVKGEEVFRVSEQTIMGKRLERELCRPLLSNESIKRYLLDWKGEYLILSRDETDIDKYPRIKGHLTRFKPLLELRYDIQKRNGRWYAMANLRNIEKILSDTDRLITPYIAPENRFALVRGNDYIYKSDVYVIMPRDDCSVSIEYILALLNSRLLEFVHKRTAKALDGSAMTSKGIPGRRFSYQSEYVGQLPIRVPSDRQEEQIQGELMKLVGSMMKLLVRWSSIDVEFAHYMTEPVLELDPFKRYYNTLTIADKSVSDNYGKGSIRRIEVDEEGEWLVFKVDYSVRAAHTTKKREPVNDHEVVRCRFPDEVIRRFIYEAFVSYKGRLGSGNLLSKILSVGIPVLNRDPEKNRQEVEKVVEAYLDAVKERRLIEDEIIRIDTEINERVYRLYDLDPAEIATIEESYG